MHKTSFAEAFRWWYFGGPVSLQQEMYDSITAKVYVQPKDVPAAYLHRIVRCAHLVRKKARRKRSEPMAEFPRRRRSEKCSCDTAAIVPQVFAHDSFTKVIDSCFISPMFVKPHAREA